ncbi:MAG: glutamyl-tRNA reductase, partial [Vicinamibacteria bacterium]
VEAGAARMMIANRTRERAESLALQFGGSVIPLEKVGEHLAGADVVLSAVSAPSFLIEPKAVTDAVAARDGGAIFLIDIAVPRSVDPAVNEIENAFLFDIDDLEKLAETHARSRRKEAAQAEAIIDTAKLDFYRWMNTLDAVPTLKGLREWGDRVAEQELEKLLRRLPGLTQSEKESVRQVVRGIVNKMLHRPMTALKDLSGDRTELYYLAAVRRLFGLDRDSGDEE